MCAGGCSATRFEAAPERSEGPGVNVTAGNSTNDAWTSSSLGAAPASSDVAATANGVEPASKDGGASDASVRDAAAEPTTDGMVTATDSSRAASAISRQDTGSFESVAPDSGASRGPLDASVGTRDGASVGLDAGVTDERDAARSEVSASDVATTQPDDPNVCNEGEFDAPQLVMGLGYDDRMWGPAISSDGNVLLFGYTSTNEDLYMATLAPGETRWFENVSPLTSLNTGGSEGTPFLSYDALTLYFYATREGGPGDRDLWFATRQGERDDFGEPQQVLGVNGGNYDHLPWLSDDELRIYYTTERDGGLGRSDLWTAKRASKQAAFEEPVLVPGVNSEYREDAIAFSPDRLTVYFTTDRATAGDLDIWRATRSSRGADFSDPEIVPGLNSDSEDTNLALTRDGKRLYFSSGRDGKQRLWVAARTCR